MLLIRYVAGNSMAPALRPGRVVIALRQGPWSQVGKIRLGDVVIIRHDGLEKIKRITDIRRTSTLDIDKIYVEGDNKAQSTDSRHFGWLEKQSIQGKIIWPMLKKLPKLPTSPPR